MQQEIRFATFNVCNLAPPGEKLYDNLAPLTEEEYAAKVQWTAGQLDALDADVIGFQEIFSQQVLRDVLARTRLYREATHAGFDTPPGAERLTPNLALVSRLPLASPATQYDAFPAGVALPDGRRDADTFARAPLHAQVMLPGGHTVEVIVVHLKSKRPDYRTGDDGGDPLLYAMANLRSLIRRGTEAVALRVLLSQLSATGSEGENHAARHASIVLGAGATATPGEEFNGRMFDSQRIQQRQEERRHADNYTNIHDGRCMTIDHILVSEEFNPASPHAIGEVLEVQYLNGHLRGGPPEASDHGQVRTRIRLYDSSLPSSLPGSAVPA